MSKWYYTFSGSRGDPINDDDVDFKKYDPIAIKPYSMLSAAEMQQRAIKYPPVVTPPGVAIPAKPPAKPLPKTAAPKPKPSIPGPESDFVISGPLPDSVRFKRFKSKKEAEDYIKTLKLNDAGE